MTRLTICFAGWQFAVGLIAGGQLQAQPTAPGSTTSDTHKTEVVILGGLHNFHQKNTNYSAQTLLQILVACKPDAILAEVPATRNGKPLVKDGRFSEKMTDPDELWASQEAAQKLNIPIRPFDIDRRDDARRESRYWQRREEAEKEYAAFLKGHEGEGLPELRALEHFDEDRNRALFEFAENGTPRIINSEALDSMLRGRKRLMVVADRAFERLLKEHPEMKSLQDELHFVRHEWQHRNEAMADNIVAWARQYRSKRIVVVVGVEHRHFLRDRTGLALKEYWQLQ